MRDSPAARVWTLQVTVEAQSAQIGKPKRDLGEDLDRQRAHGQGLGFSGGREP